MKRFALTTALAVALLSLPLTAQLGSPATAEAVANHVVTTTADGNNGGCTPSLCTFRDAITAAEADGGTVVVPAGHYTGTMLGANGVFSPDGEFTIKGAGAGKTIIDGNQLSRTFAFYGQITVRGVTVTGGKAPLAGCSCGAGFEVRSGGALTLVDSVVAGNTAGSSSGGGIDVDSNATAVLTNVVVSGNSADDGAGIHVDPSMGQTGRLTMTNVTLFGNTATGNGGGLYVEGTVTARKVTIGQNTANGAGGGVWVKAGASVRFDESTLAGNGADNANGLYNAGASTAVRVRNTIIADSAAADCAGSSTPVLTSEGHNLERGHTCAFTGEGDLRNKDPKIVSLKPAGGNGLPVFVLASTSPAVNRGDNPSCSSTDERGLPRPSGSRCDIGAYEYQFPGKAVVAFPKRTVRLSSATKGVLPVQCRNVVTDRCSVKANLVTTAKKQVLLGSVKGVVAGKKSGNLTITLNKAGAKLLKKKATVLVKGTSANRVGSKVAVKVTITVLPR
ncbi:choice-of-anchor Q domain-containing protein [Nocardioides sp.]|uniref:choice-of-anchor Q domain-containing protein n=1 Tax=Nocardioides sp. TaxID=35761 RepID=UPI0037842446